MSNHQSLDSSVKEWYVSAYPTDDLGPELNPELTFDGVYSTLAGDRDVYKAFGLVDSVIRERVFGKLADLKGVEYDHIYNLWLHPPKQSLSSQIHSAQTTGHSGVGRTAPDAHSKHPKLEFIK